MTLVRYPGHMWVKARDTVQFKLQPGLDERTPLQMVDWHLAALSARHRVSQVDVDALLDARNELVEEMK